MINDGFSCSDGAISLRVANKAVCSKVRGTCVAPRVPIVDYLLGDGAISLSMIFCIYNDVFVNCL